MLEKFAVTNFRGFAERLEWDLSHPSNYEFNDYAVKNGVIKNAIIYGANGSGKSNFSFAVFDIINHLTQKHKNQEFYENSVYAGHADVPMTFEYTFKFDEDILEYNYQKNVAGELLTERLCVNNKTIIDRHGAKTKYDASLAINEKAFNTLFKDNANKVSVISYLWASIPYPTSHYLIKLRNFVNSMLWFRNVDDRGYMGLLTGRENLEEYIIRNGYVKDFAKFLEDISGQHFEFAETSKDDKELICLIEGGAIPFFNIESTGTRSLTLLYYWLTNIKDASLVFIDEFDAFYHYKLSFEICKKLFSLKNCQVFLTSHNTYLMTNDLLRPDCNFIIGNNLIKPLYQCTEKELRFGHNIEKIYRSGAFHVN